MIPFQFLPIDLKYSLTLDLQNISFSAIEAFENSLVTPLVKTSLASGGFFHLFPGFSLE
jgi:hypothetical protein